jgi:hypothetical protein
MVIVLSLKEGINLHVVLFVLFVHALFACLFMSLIYFFELLSLHYYLTLGFIISFWKMEWL